MNIKLFIPGSSPVQKVLRQILDKGLQTERQEEANVVIVYEEEALRAYHPGTDNPGQDFVLLSANDPGMLPSRTVWSTPSLTDLLPHLQKLSEAKA